ncbi:hypothetical protein AURDEDRAFT_182342 [Auricularia subglabra TFB-10046 SS5]|nr:hypothetical protein AURDEDRAFT_182342 [Auricularia subglabra TFB-10046 SS5]
MTDWSRSLFAGQVLLAYPPTPRPRASSLPPDDLLDESPQAEQDPAGARESVAALLTPPASPRAPVGPKVHLSLAQPLVEVALGRVAGDKAIDLLRPFGRIRARATLPALSHIVLRFPDIQELPDLSVMRSTGVTVRDVLSAVDRFLNAHSAVAFTLHGRYAGRNFLTLRMEWAHGNVFTILIDRGH